MQYSLTGFTLDTGCRVFAFQSVEPQKVRTLHTVRIDLSLARSYGLMVQELPLLCLALLTRQDVPVSRVLTFTEDDMRANANVRAADKEEALRKKSMRKTPPRRPAADPMEQSMVRVGSEIAVGVAAGSERSGLQISSWGTDQHG
jgi:hypothetical protein